MNVIDGVETTAEVPESAGKVQESAGEYRKSAGKILRKMVENEWLRKEGASRNIIYVINQDKRLEV